jgi:anti-sigma regulatory factor (Ser/Thr protein kinase)
VDTDEIVLTLPAEPRYGRVARIAAAHLALRKGFSLTEIDDLRLAIDEAVILLLGPTIQAGEITVHYRVGGNRIEVELERETTGEVLAEERTDRFRSIVAGLVEVQEINPDGSLLRLTKSRAAGSD